MAGIELTPAILKKYCKDNGLYSTPSINDKIYLHYKGLKRIQSLEEYTGLKAIWLEGNGLSKIEGLENQTKLRSLFLHENLIEKIEGLDSQVDLDALNLSKNFVKRIENLSHMTQLTSLNLSHNHLCSAEDIEQVTEIHSLQTLDIQHNKIDDIKIVDIVSKIKDLRVLYLMGNPVVRNIKHYRKTLIAKCKMLKYLDDRPVFDEERRRVEVWYTAYESSNFNLDTANEAEKLELAKIRQEKKDIDDYNFRAFEDLMRKGAEIKRQRELAGKQPEDSNINPFSKEPIIDVPESDIVRLAREEMWGAKSVPFSERQSSSQLNAESLTQQATSSVVVNESALKLAETQLASSVAPTNLPKPAWAKLTIEEVNSELIAEVNVEEKDIDDEDDEVSDNVDEDDSDSQESDIIEETPSPPSSDMEGEEGDEVIDDMAVRDNQSGGKFSSLLMSSAREVENDIRQLDVKVNTDVITLSQSICSGGLAELD